ncbi:MAG: YbaB/EbfC family nucleoid-associated protein [Candidatus Uhrbacteria bacterium]
MFNKIKAVKDLRTQAKQMQNALSEVSDEGSSAWGKIKVKIDGNQQVLAVSIDDEMMKDRAKLEEAMAEAFNDAVTKIQKKMAAKMKEMGGLDALKNLGL